MPLAVISCVLRSTWAGSSLCLYSQGCTQTWSAWCSPVSTQFMVSVSPSCATTWSLGWMDSVAVFAVEPVKTCNVHASWRLGTFGSVPNRGDPYWSFCAAFPFVGFSFQKLKLRPPSNWRGGAAPPRPTPGSAPGLCLSTVADARLTHSGAICGARTCCQSRSQGGSVQSGWQLFAGRMMTDEWVGTVDSIFHFCNVQHQSGRNPRIAHVRTCPWKMFLPGSTLSIQIVAKLVLG